MPSSSIQDIWRQDLDAAFTRIARIVETYNYVAIDTEYPGTVLLPDHHEHRSLLPEARNFLMLRGNVNHLKIIQIGFSFSDEHGNKPEGCNTYQFNFHFDLQKEIYAPDAIHLLHNAGLDFPRHASDDAIRLDEFGELLMTSGLVLNDEVHWISFHGMYDFAYPLSLLTNLDLPEDPEKFFEILYLFFPNITDLKFQNGPFRGGLQALALQLGAVRYGMSHQAGSDSLLTMDVFFRLEEKKRMLAFDGRLFGLHPDVLSSWYCSQNHLAVQRLASSVPRDEPLYSSRNGLGNYGYHPPNDEKDCWYQPTA